MCCYFEIVAIFVVVFLAIVPHSQADFEQFSVTFVGGKTVTTNYLTLERFSIVQCVEKCYNEGKNGRCSVAGYNRATQTCRLSMDSEQDVEDIPDASNGVFIFQGTLELNAVLQLYNFGFNII